jgi:hypothetical protein
MQAFFKSRQSQAANLRAWVRRDVHVASAANNLRAGQRSGRAGGAGREAQPRPGGPSGAQVRVAWTFFTPTPRLPTAAALNLLRAAAGDCPHREAE